MPPRRRSTVAASTCGHPDPRRLAALALLVLVGAGAGCGVRDDRRQVRAVTDRFSSAIASKDGAAACAALSEDTAKQIESQESKPCPSAIVGLGLPTSRAVRVQIFLTSAKVDLAGGATAFLGRTKSGWKLSAIGCKAAQGKPRDRPFECEVEA
jgi:hypothetical protein